MEKETRNAIERATQRARGILEKDFAEQLQGDYDVMQDGRVGERPAARLTGASASKPVILYVGFPVLYRSSHIPDAILAGPVSKPEGLDALRQAVAKLPHNSEIVIYCGCCPFDHCPNIRPAYAELHRLGFDRITVLSIPTNMSKDWIAKGYPTQK